MGRYTRQVEKVKKNLAKYPHTRADSRWAAAWRSAIYGARSLVSTPIALAAVFSSSRDESRDL